MESEVFEILSKVCHFIHFELMSTFQLRKVSLSHL